MLRAAAAAAAAAVAAEEDGVERSGEECQWELDPELLELEE